LSTMSTGLGKDETPVARQTYRLEEVAVLLGVSLMQARRCAELGVFPTIRLGKKLLVAPREPIHRLIRGEAA
jgi:hypothetical protein